MKLEYNLIISTKIKDNSVTSCDGIGQRDIFQLTHILPDNLKSSLPCIEELEAEFANGENL